MELEDDLGEDPTAIDGLRDDIIATAYGLQEDQVPGILERIRRTLGLGQNLIRDGDLIEASKPMAEDLPQLGAATSDFAPWLREIRNMRSNDLKEIQRAVFGGDFGVWFKQYQDLKGRPELIAKAAQQMFRDISFEEFLNEPNTEKGIEIIRFAVKENIYLGTKYYANFIEFGLRPLGFSSLPNFDLSIKEYIELISVIGTARVQDYLNSPDFKNLRPSQRMEGLMKKLKEGGFLLERKDLRNLLLNCLPLQLTAQVNKEDLYSIEKDPLSLDLHNSLPEKRQEAVERYYQHYLESFERDGASYYYRGRFLSELLKVPFKADLEVYKEYGRNTARELLSRYSEGGYSGEAYKYIQTQQRLLFSNYLTDSLRPFNQKEIIQLLSWLQGEIDGLIGPLGEKLDLSTEEVGPQMTPGDTTDRRDPQRAKQRKYEKPCGSVLFFPLFLAECRACCQGCFS